MGFQKGTTLIEVLFTFAITSMALFSLLNLQVISLKGLSTTNQNYLATSISASIISSIKADKEHLPDYDGKETITFSKDCSTSTCSMSEQNISLWKQVLESESHNFPGVNAKIALDNSTIEVIIEWSKTPPNNNSVKNMYKIEATI